MVLVRRTSSANHVKKSSEAALQPPAGWRISDSYNLEYYQRRLNNIMKPVMYAMDTFQPQLFAPLVREAHGGSAPARRGTRENQILSRHTSGPNIVLREGRNVVQRDMSRIRSASARRSSATWRTTIRWNAPRVQTISQMTSCTAYYFSWAKASAAEFMFRNISAMNHQENGVPRGILRPSVSSASTTSR